MANTLRTPRVRVVLDRLFAAAPMTRKRRAGGSRASHGKPPPRKSGQAPQSPPTCPSHLRAATCSTFLLGQRARTPLLSSVRRTEFPPSNLAAVVADSRMGRVISTELSRAKVFAARANLAEAGLGDHVTILLGDA